LNVTGSEYVFRSPTCPAKLSTVEFSSFFISFLFYFSLTDIDLEATMGIKLANE
jgi:hypothetical protein